MLTSVNAEIYSALELHPQVPIDAKSLLSAIKCSNPVEPPNKDFKSALMLSKTVPFKYVCKALFSYPPVVSFDAFHCEFDFVLSL